MRLVNEQKLAFRSVIPNAGLRVRVRGNGMHTEMNPRS